MNTQSSKEKFMRFQLVAYVGAAGLWKLFLAFLQSVYSFWVLGEKVFLKVITGGEGRLLLYRSGIGSYREEVSQGSGGQIEYVLIE